MSSRRRSSRGRKSDADDIPSGPEQQDPVPSRARGTKAVKKEAAKALKALKAEEKKAEAKHKQEELAAAPRGPRKAKAQAIEKHLQKQQAEAEAKKKRARSDTVTSAGRPRKNAKSAPAEDDGDDEGAQVDVPGGKGKGKSAGRAMSSKAARQPAADKKARRGRRKDDSDMSEDEDKRSDVDHSVGSGMEGLEDFADEEPQPVEDGKVTAKRRTNPASLNTKLFASEPSHVETSAVHTPGVRVPKKKTKHFSAVSGIDSDDELSVESDLTDLDAEENAEMVAEVPAPRAPAKTASAQKVVEHTAQEVAEEVSEKVATAREEAVKQAVEEGAEDVPEDAEEESGEEESGEESSGEETDGDTTDDGGLDAPFSDMSIAGPPMERSIISIHDSDTDPGGPEFVRTKDRRPRPHHRVGYSPDEGDPGASRIVPRVPVREPVRKPKVKAEPEDEDMPPAVSKRAWKFDRLGQPVHESRVKGLARVERNVAAAEPASDEDAPAAPKPKPKPRPVKKAPKTDATSASASTTADPDVAWTQGPDGKPVPVSRLARLENIRRNAAETVEEREERLDSARRNALAGLEERDDRATTTGGRSAAAGKGKARAREVEEKQESSKPPRAKGKKRTEAEIKADYKQRAMQLYDPDDAIVSQEAFEESVEAHAEHVIGQMAQVEHDMREPKKKGRKVTVEDVSEDDGDSDDGDDDQGDNKKARDVKGKGKKVKIEHDSDAQGRDKESSKKKGKDEVALETGVPDKWKGVELTVYVKDGSCAKISQQINSQIGETISYADNFTLHEGIFNDIGEQMFPSDRAGRKVAITAAIRAASALGFKKLEQRLKEDSDFANLVADRIWERHSTVRSKFADVGRIIVPDVYEPTVPSSGMSAAAVAAALAKNIWRTSCLKKGDMYVHDGIWRDVEKADGTVKEEWYVDKTNLDTPYLCDGICKLLGEAFLKEDGKLHIDVENFPLSTVYKDKDGQPVRMFRLYLVAFADATIEFVLDEYDKGKHVKDKWFSAKYLKTAYERHLDWMKANWSLQERELSLSMIFDAALTAAHTRPVASGSKPKPGPKSFEALRSAYAKKM